MRFLKSIFFCITISLTACQSYLYWPTKDMYVDTTQLPIAPADERIQLNQNENLHAWIFKTPAKKPKGVFVQFHGNAQNMTAHFMFLYWVLGEGYDLVTFDYRGYGQSSDFKPTPESTTEDALKILEFVAERYSNTKRIVVGQSIGSAILLSALIQAKAELQPDFIVLDSPFASYKKAARSVLKQRWFLYPLIPFSYMAFSDKFAPIDKLDKLGSQPKIVIHGTDDSVIRFELGKEVFDKIPEKKEFWSIEGGYHTAAFSQLYMRTYSKKLISAIEASAK